MKKKFLITTADERSWKFDRPVLFLGEWCCHYDRRCIWEHMDAEVAAPFGVQAEQKVCNLSYHQKLTNELLIEVSDALNKYHKTKHSLRYWHILLGHWLQRFVAVIFNRYFTLDQVLKNYKIQGTAVFDSLNYSLATTDSMAFIWACGDPIWNHVLYSRILNFRDDKKKEISIEPLETVSGYFKEQNSSFGRKNSVKQLIIKAIRIVFSKLRRGNDAFIIRSYLPLLEEAKLQILLGQFPQFWGRPALDKIEPDMEGRKDFNINAEKHSGFEQFVRRQLNELIPACYLEGYTQLLKTVDELPWPTEPKFIFTSNEFDTNEVFKAWVGAKVEKNVPYYTGQHGNNYGSMLGSPYWPELNTCDRFFTWGWKDGNPKNIPAFTFTMANRKNQPKRYDGNLLLIEGPQPSFLTLEDRHHNFGIYREEQFRFVEALSANIRQKLIVRLFGHKLKESCDEQRWKDRSPDTKIDTGTKTFRAMLSRSRLAVFAYDSTGILETLSLGYPTICFWFGGLDHLLPNAKPYYEILRDAEILFDTPEAAAEFVETHWENIKEWWESAKVRNVREVFCNQFARIEKHPVRTMKRLLTTP